MADEIVTNELRSGVAILRLDDGKANALSVAMQSQIHAGLDLAEKQAQSLVIAGRPGRFSGGFDLSVMAAGDSSAVRAMVKGGAELALRLYEFPIPVVVACTGHAIAMGSVLLLAADTRIGIEGDFKLGLNEVAIRMTLPMFAVEFARDRLSRRHLQRALNLAEIYSPREAVDAGYLDRVVAPEALLDEAIAEAKRYEPLDLHAHHGTKRNLRGATIERIRASLDAL
jgi:enoyl-CoA hydratase